jgi:predicted transcriptional regulator
MTDFKIDIELVQKYGAINGLIASYLFHKYLYENDNELSYTKIKKELNLDRSIGEIEYTIQTLDAEGFIETKKDETYEVKFEYFFTRKKEKVLE